MKKFKLTNENTSLRLAYQAAVIFLRESGVDDPETDAMLLLEKAAGCSRNGYFMRRDESFQAVEASRFCEMISKRGARIPLQHITGEAFFTE